MKTLLQLVVPFQVKADAIDLSARTFEGLAAVWDLDLGGDIIHRGAFVKTLGEWKASGQALPLLNSHGHWDIMDAVGQLLEAEERDAGLWTKWEVIDGADGDRVLTRIRPSARNGRAVIGKMSIGYEPVKFDFEQIGDNQWDTVRHLRELALGETSLVIFPMAPGAAIDATSVKMFLQSAKGTDPASVDLKTKAELRRLASRIGILLKAKKEGDTSDAPEVPDSPTAPAPAEVPAAPAPVAPVVPVVPAVPAPVAPAPSTPTPEAPTAPAPAPAPAPSEPPAPSTPAVPAPSPEVPAPLDAPSDLMSDSKALQQRVRGALVRHAVRATTPH